MLRQETELACSHLAGSGTQAYNSMSALPSLGAAALDPGHSHLPVSETALAPRAHVPMEVL